MFGDVASQYVRFFFQGSVNIGEVFFSSHGSKFGWRKEGESEDPITTSFMNLL